MKISIHLRAIHAAGLLFGLAAASNTVLAQDPATNRVESTPDVTTNETNVPVEKFWSHFDTSFATGQSGPMIFSDLVIPRGQTNLEDAVVIRGNSTIDGEVHGDSVTVLGDATINGKITGDLVVVLGSVKLGPQADVGGDVVVLGGKVDRATGAKTGPGGVVVLNIPGYAWINEGLLKGRLFPPSVGWVWMVAAVCLGINLLLLLLFPRPLQACVNTIEARPLISVFTGILTKMLAGLLTLLLVITMVGVLLVPLLCAANLVALFFGKITTYRYVGQQLGKLLRLGFLQNSAAALILGTAVFYLLYMVPFLGLVAWGFSGIFGLGAVVLTLFDQMRTRRPSPATPAFPGAVPPAAADYPAAAFSGIPPGSVAAAEARPPYSSAAPAKAPLVRAGFWIRLFALALDAILFLILFGVISHSSLDDDWFGLPKQDICLLSWLLYHVFLWTWKGTTIGGIVAGIKVVRLDARPVDFPVALIRALASVLSFFALGLGFFWVGMTPDKQSWHDKIAGTVMVKAAPGTALM